MSYRSPQSLPIPGTRELICDVGTITTEFAVAESSFKKADAAMASIRRLIRLVERGLEPGMSVATMTSAFPSPTSWMRGLAPDLSLGPTHVYTPGEDGEYRSDSSIITPDGELPFLGSRLLLQHSTLVVVNEEHQLGLSVVRNVFLVEADSELGEQFGTVTLPLLESRERGAHQHLPAPVDAIQ